MEHIKVTHEDIQQCIDFFKLNAFQYSDKEYVVGIPKGGNILAMGIAQRLNKQLISMGQFLLEDTEFQKDTIMVDDVLDSGATVEKLPTPGAYVFYAGKATTEQVLVQHKAPCFSYSLKTDQYIDFYWEEDNQQAGPQDAVIRQLQYIGEDINREGLVETPNRVVRSWDHLFSGYDKNPDDLLVSFAEGACDDIVVLRNCEMYSTCEHHLIPFVGFVDIAYIPNGRVLGISKLARLMEIYARRAQIQERIGDQITDFLMNKAGAKGAACRIRAKHLCMTARGVEKQHSEMVTSSMKGVFRTKPEARAEVLSLFTN